MGALTPPRLPAWACGAQSRKSNQSSLRRRPLTSPAYSATSPSRFVEGCSSTRASSFDARDSGRPARIPAGIVPSPAESSPALDPSGRSPPARIIVHLLRHDGPPRRLGLSYGGRAVPLLRDGTG